MKLAALIAIGLAASYFAARFVGAFIRSGAGAGTGANDADSEDDLLPEEFARRTQV